MRRSKQRRDKAGLQTNLLTGWHLIPAREEDEMLPSGEGWSCVAWKNLSSQQAAAPARGANPGTQQSQEVTCCLDAYREK